MYKNYKVTNPELINIEVDNAPISIQGRFWN